MTRASSSRSINNPQPDIAALDRETGDFHEKINTVYEILGLDDTTVRHNLEEPKYAKVAFSAREEAVLRWLLGALEGSGAPRSRQVYVKSYCYDLTSLTFYSIIFSLRLDPRSWYLTSYLIQRIPTANTALLLSTHKFLQVLDSTLHDATDEKRLSPGTGQVAAQGETAYHPSIASDIRGNSSSEISESSRTTTGSPLSLSVSSSRKRKRQRLPAGSYRIPVERPWSDSDIGSLFSSILMALECILALTTTPDIEGKKPIIADCSRVHMKAALRGKPDIASRIMGAWFRMIYLVTSSSKGNLDGYSIHTDDSCLNPVIQIWHNRSLERDEGPDHVSKAFSSNCLVPALLLLSKLTSVPEKSKMVTNGIRSIESLLVHHILLPARVSFLNLSIAPATIAWKGEGQQTSLLADLLEPLQLEVSSAYKTSRLTNSCGETWTNISRAIALFFELAIRCSTNGKAKRWDTDTLWRENVLITLAGSVGLVVSPPTTTEIQPAKVDLLEQMLQTAIQNKISLSPGILRPMVVNCSCLLSGADKEIRWKLLEKFSGLDEDIFYAFVEADSKLLHSLLTRITNLTVPESKGDLDDKYSVARIILTRLLEAFNRAHNMTGFISHWHRELEIVERKRLGSSTSDALRATGLSVWEDEDLIMETGSMLGKSLTLKQTKEVLASSEFNIGQSLNGAPDPEVDIRTFVSLITLDAIFSSIGRDLNATLDIVEENIRSVHGTLIQLASYPSYLKSHRWRIWKAISQIQEFGRVTAATMPSSLDLNTSLFSNVCKMTGHGMHTLLQTALENAHSSLERGFPGIKQSKMGPECYFEAFLAFDFILHMAQGSITAFPSGESAEAIITVILNRSVEFLAVCLSQLAARVGHEIPMWNGKLQGLTGEQALGVALTARLMVYYPEVLLQIPSTARTHLFQLLHELASLTSQNWEKPTSQTCQISFVRTWDSILGNENLLRHAKLKDELIGTLSNSLCIGRSGVITPGVESNNMKALAVLSLTKLPPEVFQRAQRERILNAMTEPNFRDQAECNLSNNSLSDQISLILKLTDAPNASAMLATDPKALWNLSEVIGQSRLCPTALACRGFGDIVKKNLRHLILTRDQERSHQYLRSFSESLHSFLSNISSLENNLGFLQLIGSSLLTLWPHLEVLPGDTVDILQDMHRKYLHLLLSDLMVWKQRLENDHASANPFVKTLVDAVIGFPGLGSMANDDETRVILQAVRDAVFPLFPRLLQLPDDSSEEKPDSGSKSSISDSLGAASPGNPLNKAIYSAWLSVYLLKLGRKVADRSDRTSIERSGLTQPDREFLYSTFHGFAMSLKQTDKLSLLLYLEKMAFQGFAFSGECYMLLLRALVSDGNVGTRTQTADISKALSGLYSKLCLNLSQVRGFRQFRLVIDTMGLIADKKLSAITQWNIDETLSIIASIASSSGPLISTDRSGAIYLRLCKATRGIIESHRLKLRGRFHLIIPLMQSLLRCLFIPNRSKESEVEMRALTPPWLSANIVATAPYATAYARLLCMLCDPTTSSVSVSSNHRRQELTPATTKVRRVAGQYMPYILEEYIQCQLRYRLSTEVKSALTPGLYAVLEVSSLETMRMVNAAMDASGRALFKNLYTDYGRFGKWEERQ